MGDVRAAIDREIERKQINTGNGREEGIILTIVRGHKAIAEQPHLLTCCTY